MIASNPVYSGREARLGPHELLTHGKVRDIYAVDAEHLLFVTSDRISAFDVVMPAGIPHKGRVLTAIAAHWFERTRDIIPNHLVSTRVEDVPQLPEEHHEALRGRVMLVRRCEPTAIEWVIRGYIAGSGWKEYQTSQTVCDLPLPAGLEFCGKLPEPLLTPDHEGRAPRRARASGRGAPHRRSRRCTTWPPRPRRHSSPAARRSWPRSASCWRTPSSSSARSAAELVLIDEALTPDSSRFWPAESYQPGRNQPSLDKQILRDYLETLDWNKEAPGPELPEEVVERIAKRYLEVCERITGKLPEGVPA